MPSNKLNHKPPNRSTAVPHAGGQQNVLSRPSVPLSVYKELAAELQAAKVMLDSLHGQNQALTKQNQLLRLEIERAVQATLQMKQVADSLETADLREAVEEILTAPRLREPVAEVSQPAPQRPAPRQPAPRSVPPEAPALSKELYTEQEGSRPSLEQKSEKPDLSGVWLAIVILLIVFSAFGAGFLIVRPFLQNR